MQQELQRSAESVGKSTPDEKAKKVVLPGSSGDNKAAAVLEKRSKAISEGSARSTGSVVEEVVQRQLSKEELDEQLERILYAIGQLQRIQERGRYISDREVIGLRNALEFVKKERAQLLKRGVSPQGSALSTPSTVISSSTPDTVEADLQVPSNPKEAAANRYLMALEEYVKLPRSRSFEDSTKFISWRSIFHTPGERRMQSLMASIFLFFTGIPICLFISALLLCCKYTAPLMIIYLVSIFTIDRPKYPMRKHMSVARHPIWRHYRDYFPIRLEIPRQVRRKFDSSRNYFFVYHPHGIHTFGAIICFGLDINESSRMLPGIRTHLQTLKVNFYVPFWRALMKWMGVGDASASCIRKTLRAGPGESVMLVVGGAEESLMAKPNTNDLLLLKRKGFVKIALQEGTPLVPVYGFGENNVYGISPLANNRIVKMVMEMVRKVTGFAIPLIVGRGYFIFNFGLIPRRRPVVVVVGDPIELPKIAEPTAEDLEYWQGKYIEGLQALYQTHRGAYDLESTGLRIMK